MEKDEKMIVVKTCSSLFEAELVVGHLEAEGVPASIHNCSDTAYLSSPYGAGNTFDVVVLGSDLALATEVLKCNS